MDLIWALQAKSDLICRLTVAALPFSSIPKVRQARENGAESVRQLSLRILIYRPLMAFIFRRTYYFKSFCFLFCSFAERKETAYAGQKRHYKIDWITTLYDGAPVAATSIQLPFLAWLVSVALLRCEKCQKPQQQRHSCAVSLPL